MSPVATKNPTPKVVVAPICPICGKEALTVGSQYGPKHVCCDLWSYDGRPLVDRATHRERVAVHGVLDPLWKDGHLSRTEAYHLLAREMQMRKNECHISNMNLDQLARARYAIEVIKFRTNFRPTKDM